MTSRRSFLQSAAATLPATVLHAQIAHPLTNPFFAMDTAMARNLGTPLDRADIDALAQLGYSGVGPIVLDANAWRHLINDVIPWLNTDHLKLYAVYSWAHISRQSFEIDPGIKANIASLPRGTFIWLPITSKEFAPSDPAGDEQSAAAVRAVADIVAPYGCGVSIYPHYGQLVQRIADAVRVCEKANRPNVTVTFNLCHRLRTDGPDTMDRDLKLAAPHLSLVTINGADRNGTDWKQLIQPLDQGNFNVGAFLHALQRFNFRGPIGLQGYDVAKNWNISPQDNLRRSMSAWKGWPRKTA